MPWSGLLKPKHSPFPLPHQAMDDREMRSNASLDLTNMGDAVEYMPGFNDSNNGGGGAGGGGSDSSARGRRNFSPESPQAAGGGGSPGATRTPSMSRHAAAQNAPN